MVNFNKNVNLYLEKQLNSNGFCKQFLINFNVFNYVNYIIANTQLTHYTKRSHRYRLLRKLSILEFLKAENRPLISQMVICNIVLSYKLKVLSTKSSKYKKEVNSVTDTTQYRVMTNSQARLDSFRITYYTTSYFDSILFTLDGCT